MTLAAIHEVLDVSETIPAIASWLEQSADEIRRLYQRLKGDAETDALLRKIVGAINKRGTALKRHASGQALLTLTALYFQNRENLAWTRACVADLYPDSRFYNRLKAWLHWQKYNDHVSYLSELDRYLALLTADLRVSDTDDTTYELLTDLGIFVGWVNEHLPAAVGTALTNALREAPRQAQFPVLKAYAELGSEVRPEIRIAAHSTQEYAPSDIMAQLFNRVFIEPLRQRSVGFPNNLLGYRAETIRYDIIRCGQADFDAQYESLSPSDIVLLYCYFNMRKHYCTSLSMFQRSNVCETCCGAKRAPIKFIDIGCGPGTAGLALMEYLHSSNGAAAPIHYYGIDSSAAMCDMAGTLLRNPYHHPDSRYKFHRSISEISVSDIGGRGCIILNACYVFASPTLDTQELLDYIRALKAAYANTPIYFFFQNSVKETLNQSYAQFKATLVNYRQLFSAKEVIPYRTRKSFYSPTKEPVFFEALQL